MRISPFSALRPTPETVASVACAPYDTVDADEARRAVEENPKSFLRVVRAESELPVGVDAYSRDVYATARENLARFERDGLLVRESSPSLYVYRLRMGEHVQRGVVACCHVSDYEGKVIRRHERTLADKEFDRARLLDALSAHPGLVFMTYRDNAAVGRIVADAERGRPLFAFSSSDGIEHTVWRVSETTQLTAAFACVEACYVADGHHRAAAAERAAAQRRERSGAAGGDEPYNWFPTVLFPNSQVNIMAYNRVVRDLNGMTRGAFLEDVRGRFLVTENAAPAPAAPRNISMYLGGHWYGLGWDGDATPAVQPSLGASGTEDDPVGSLDVTYLQEHLLEPLLAIGNYSAEPRIDFVGGIRGTQALEQRVSSGAAAVAFSMYPVTAEQIMAVADAGKIMPPKSTWFEPKLRSGLFVHTF